MALTVAKTVAAKAQKARKKGAKDRSRHGLNALLARVKVCGLESIDKRTAAAKALLRWRKELIHDLGGAEAISAQKMMVIDDVIRLKLYVDHLDNFLLAQKSLIDRRRKTVLPLLRDRIHAAESLVRKLQTLGLDRVEIDGGTLPESWITKVKPYEPEPDPEQSPAPAEETSEETS